MLLYYDVTGMNTAERPDGPGVNGSINFDIGPLSILTAWNP